MSDPVRFVHGDALYLLLLLPFIWLGCRRYLAYLRESRNRLDASIDSVTAAPFQSLVWARLAAVFFLIAAALLVLAMARPQVFKAEREAILRQLDVVFLLDVSPSMGAEDVAPSRLERATGVIREIVVREPLIQRVGLVTFAGSSLILSYLTSDVENILFYLDFLNQQHLPGIGTNIGAAIASGMQVVELGRENTAGPQNHPVMILLSDGEDHEEELEASLRTASGAQLRIYTIGIASEAGGFIPLRDEEGHVEFVEDLHGTRLISRLDESTLKRVAEVTGARFHRALEGEQVIAALQEILSRERQVVGFRENTVWRDRYHSVLVAAFVLALLGWTVARG